MQKTERALTEALSAKRSVFKDTSNNEAYSGLYGQMAQWSQVFKICLNMVIEYVNQKEL